MALDWIKAAIEVARRSDNVELERQLMDARQEFNDLREANFELQKKVKELEEELSRTRGAVYYREPWYYSKNSDGNEDGPFCPNCYDTKKQLVRAPRRTVGMGGVIQECPSCSFKRYEKQPSRPATVTRGRGWMDL